MQLNLAVWNDLNKLKGTTFFLSSLEIHRTDKQWMEMGYENKPYIIL